MSSTGSEPICTNHHRSVGDLRFGFGVATSTRKKLKLDQILSRLLQTSLPLRYHPSTIRAFAEYVRKFNSCNNHHRRPSLNSIWYVDWKQYYLLHFRVEPKIKNIDHSCHAIFFWNFCRPQIKFVLFIY